MSNENEKSEEKAEEKPKVFKVPYVRISFVDRENTITDKVIDVYEWEAYSKVPFEQLQAYIEKAPGRRKLKNAQMRTARAKENEEKVAKELSG